MADSGSFGAGGSQEACIGRSYRHQCFDIPVSHQKRLTSVYEAERRSNPVHRHKSSSTPFSIRPSIPQLVRSSKYQLPAFHSELPNLLVLYVVLPTSHLPLRRFPLPCPFFPAVQIMTTESPPVWSASEKSQGLKQIDVLSRRL